MKRSQGQGRHPAARGLPTARQRWNQLDQKRKGMLYRFEEYASVTIPKVCLPDHVDQFNASIQHDWTSVGAQAVNHITNRIVLNLFRPGMPFFRLDPDRKMREQLLTAGVTEEDLRASLVSGEQDAMRVMDQKAIRPKLNEVVKNLVVVGNVLLDLTEKAAPRVFGIKKYVVKRSVTGAVIEIIIRERVLYNELDAEVQPFVPNRSSDDHESSYVEYFRRYRKVGKKWEYTQSVEDTQLPPEFSKTYTDESLPVYPLAWDLADEHDYGSGLVEDYAGDFGTLSTLSESEIKAAILASDYRWLANPAGVGDINDVKNSVTGDVIAGAKDDLSLVSLVDGRGIQAVSASADKIIRRIGQAFLLGSAVTRDAERVTAEEIRMQAMELETSLGGVYSRLAVDLQLPIAVWLLRQIDVSIQGTQLVPTIVTGLAALSRNAEAQQLGLFLGSLGQLATLPDPVLARLKISSVISVMASAHGITPDKFVKPEQQVQQEQAAAQNAAVNQQATVDAAKEGARAIANQNAER